MDPGFFFGRITVKSALRAALILAAAVIIILIAFSIYKIIDRNRYFSASGAALEESEDTGIPEFTFGAHDLKIPEAFTAEPETNWQPYRVTPEKWEDEEIMKFWVAPSEVIIEACSEENRQLIEKILEDVP